MKKIQFMDTSFRDGFQSCYGARVFTKDFLPAIEASVAAGINHFEAGGGARFQSLFFYCNESAFDMMDSFREKAGATANLQTLARGINVVALRQQPKDIIDLHAKLFKKHGITTIRNFDALNDIENLRYAGEVITKHGLKHQIVITVMDLPPGCEGAVHSADYYLAKIKEILKAEIPFDSLCFKDATGTANQRKVYETIKGARKILPKDSVIWFHTHDTAANAITQNLAAIEGGVDGIDLSKSPCSGGTCQADLLCMWHALKGTEYTLDLDYKKALEATEVFENCMKDYFLPPEATKISYMIPFSPMPGGALTANTMMMRDTNTLHLYNEVIKEMSDVIRKGGFGTSVTPVSQFYFQQAYANVTQGKWETITQGYGDMILGYFGKTPATPDQEVVKIAIKKLGKEPFSGNVLETLESGIPKAKAILQENNLEASEENIFIVASCEDKGLQFLLGNAKANVRKISETETTTPTVSSSPTGPKTYQVKVDGTSYTVEVAEGATKISQPTTSSPAPSSGNFEEVKAFAPGNILKINVQAGQEVTEGEVLIIMEAMKMESPIKANRKGKIVEIKVSIGDTVQTGDTLLIIE